MTASDAPSFVHAAQRLCKPAQLRLSHAFSKAEGRRLNGNTPHSLSANGEYSLPAYHLQEDQIVQEEQIVATNGVSDNPPREKRHKRTML